MTQHEGREGFVELNDAARLIGISPYGLRRRLRRDGLQVYAAPDDYRRRLLRVADVDRLLEPRPLRREEAAVPA